MSELSDLLSQLDGEKGAGDSGFNFGFDGENALFRNETVYSEKAVLRFNKTHMLANSKRLLIVMAAFIIVLIPLNIVTGDTVTNGIIDALLWFVGLGLFFILILFVVTPLILKATIKKKNLVAGGYGTKGEHVFYESKAVYITYNGGEKTGENIAKHEDIVKVLQNKEYIYIFNTAVTAVIIEKIAFTIGTSAEFLQFLIRKLPPEKIKFKI